MAHGERIMFSLILATRKDEILALIDPWFPTFPEHTNANYFFLHTGSGFAGTPKLVLGELWFGGATTHTTIPWLCLSLNGGVYYPPGGYR